MVCKTCLAEGQIASAVVQMTLTRSTGTIESWVCERCRQKGRITRATCRTFCWIYPRIKESMRSR